MAHGGKNESARVKRLSPLLLTLVLLQGCEALNDALVRQSLQDSGLSRSVDYQIREGLERRKVAPPVKVPPGPAPAFLDQG